MGIDEYSRMPLSGRTGLPVQSKDRAVPIKTLLLVGFSRPHLWPLRETEILGEK